MAIYEPLRDTFRELNRLLVDKQQFDAQQKLNQSNQQLKNKMLEVTIADKEFYKDMAIAGLDAKRSQQDMNKRLLDEQILGLQQQLKTGELQAVKNQALLKPREFSLNYILDNDPRLLSNLNLKKDIESLFPEGSVFDPASGGMIINGKRHKLSSYDMAQRIVPAVMAIKESYTDAPSDAIDEMEGIKLDLKGIKDRRAGIMSAESAQYANVQGLTNLSSLDDAHFAGKKAELNREENALKAKYIKLEQFTSPMGRMDYWNDKRDYFHRMANHFETMGEPGAADNIRIRAGQAATTANTWLTVGTKGRTGSKQMKEIFEKGKLKRLTAFDTLTGKLDEPLKQGETTIEPPQRKPDDAQEAGLKYIQNELNPNRFILPLYGGRATVIEIVNRETSAYIRDLKLKGMKLTKQDGRDIAMYKLDAYKKNWDAAYEQIYKAENAIGEYGKMSRKRRKKAIADLRAKQQKEFGMFVEEPYNVMTKYTGEATPE